MPSTGSLGALHFESHPPPVRRQVAVAVPHEASALDKAGTKLTAWESWALTLGLRLTAGTSWRSFFAPYSFLSALSFLCAASALSTLCTLSVGSFLSGASVGSVLSLGSVGSIMSIGCVGGVAEICW